MLSIQLLGIVSITTWTIATSYFFLKIIDLTMGLRVSVEHELLGADIVMHGLAEVSRDLHRNQNSSDITMGRRDDENCIENVPRTRSPGSIRQNRHRRSSAYIHLRSGTNFAFYPEDDEHNSTKHRRRSQTAVQLTHLSSSCDPSITHALGEGTVSGISTYL